MAAAGQKNAKLSTYQAMRDFGATPEPSGSTPIRPSDRPRFVVQKHAATRLHYDFRLEHEGVFLSWAVTRGPSLNPDDKRLAVETEPHPLDYGDFEGVIPKGQYGGGTVMLWDRGYWTPDAKYSVEAGLKKGHLHFLLDGGRMHGGWHLVRLKTDRNARGKAAERTNWLMFKATDEFADPEHPEALIQQDTSIASGRTLEAIAAGKGRAPKPFMTAPEGKPSAKAVWTSDRADGPAAAAPAPVKRSPPTPKAVKAPMPGFVLPQLCRSVAAPPAGPGWAHEIKLDGYRTQIHVKGGKTTCYSRSGLDWTERFRDIASEAARLPDCVVDSEIVALDADGRPNFAALQQALSEGKSERLVAFCFDLLWVEGEDLKSLPLRDRKARLEDVLEHQAPSGASRLRYVEHFEVSGEAFLASACQMDLEGVISKKLDAPYQSDRSDSWTKAKCRAGQEVVIGGWTGTETTLRSLLVGLHRDGRLEYAGRVGTGFTQSSAGALARRLAAIASSTSPFSGPGTPKRTGDINWCRPELVAEIQFAGWTAENFVRQASFKGLREDKSPADVVREEPAAAEPPKPERPAAAAKAPARAGGAKAPVSVRTIGISNPDKPLWPAADKEPAVTKADLARYLDAVGAWMLPHMAARPISLVRTPDGIEGGQRFFQRHAMPGQSPLVRLIEVGDRKPYLAIDTIEGLIALGQTGVTEIHPSNCLPDQPEVPGRLVFDLDPAEDVPFPLVVKAALEVRDRLAALGLESFLKSTGGKGLHVVTPLKPKRGSTVSWAEAKAFAQEVCRQAAADSPEAYVINMAKRVRGGRIFLDYLRNDRLSTAVAVLSPRARPGATVSMPLNWSQATARLDPKKFTIRTVPALLRKTDAWAGYDEAARPLQDAVKKLGKPAAARGRGSAKPAAVRSPA
jgi:bifunctional non-homologous end joining protein LigD